MGIKRRIGQIRNLILIEGDVNLIGKNEVLVTEEESYTILRKRKDNGTLDTYVVVPLEDFKKDGNISR